MLFLHGKYILLCYLDILLNEGDRRNRINVIIVDILTVWSSIMYVHHLTINDFHFTISFLEVSFHA